MIQQISVKINHNSNQRAIKTFIIHNKTVNLIILIKLPIPMISLSLSMLAISIDMQTYTDRKGDINCTRRMQRERGNKWVHTRTSNITHKYLFTSVWIADETNCCYWLSLYVVASFFCLVHVQYFLLWSLRAVPPFLSLYLSLSLSFYLSLSLPLHLSFSRI